MRNDVSPAIADTEAIEVSLGRRFLRPRTFVSFAFAFAILIFLVLRLDVDIATIWARVRSANLLLLVFALVVFYASFPLRAMRWLVLLGNAGYGKDSDTSLPTLPRLSHILLLSWFANCVLPAKLGDAYRAYLLKQTSDVSFSKTFGTILAERITDMIILFALLAAAAAGVLGGKDDSTVMTTLQVGMAMVVALIIGLLLMVRAGRLVRRFLPHRLSGIYDRFEQGTLTSFKRLPLVVTMTIGVWALEVGRLVLVTYSLDLTLAPPLLIFVALANSLLTAVPFTPGGLGLVEAGVIGLLLMAVPQDYAVSVALLDRVISYWSLIAFGVAALPFAPRR